MFYFSNENLSQWQKKLVEKIYTTLKILFLI